MLWFLMGAASYCCLTEIDSPLKGEKNSTDPVRAIPGEGLASTVKTRVPAGVPGGTLLAGLIQAGEDVKTAHGRPVVVTVTVNWPPADGTLLKSCGPLASVKRHVSGRSPCSTRIWALPPDQEIVTLPDRTVSPPGPTR
jgi:hypothetical protein